MEGSHKENWWQFLISCVTYIWWIMKMIVHILSDPMLKILSPKAHEYALVLHADSFLNTLLALSYFANHCDLPNA